MYTVMDSCDVKISVKERKDGVKKERMKERRREMKGERELN